MEEKEITKLKEINDIKELIEFIEKNYNIEIKENELIPDNFDSLNNVTYYVMRKIGNGC